MSVKQSYKNIRTILHFIEDVILVSLVVLMIGMAVLQILLRNMFDGGIVWGDSMIRISVLWIGLVGAMIASRSGEHISIDILARYFTERIKHMIHCFIGFFTAAICLIATYFSILFVIEEYKYGDKAFSIVPVWLCEGIIPIALSIIALRYFILSFVNLSKALKSAT